MTHQGGTDPNFVGCYQAVTVVPNLVYTFSFVLKKPSSGTAIPRIRINSTQFAASDSAPGNLYTNTNPTITADADVTITEDITPVTSTIYIAIGMTGSNTNYIYYDDVSFKLKGGSQIKDTNSSFGNFTTSMKILVDDSTSNDTNESSNSSVGYYTPVTVANGLLTITDAITDEAAGANITVRGQSNSYSDIIKDKRFYPIPSDAIKIKDIRVKNHLNTDDQWRSIPRMIGQPQIPDKDEI